MGVAGSVVPVVPRWHRARQVARLAAIGTGATAAAVAATGGVLLGQARQARQAIPMAEAPPPRCDGVYGAKFPGAPLTLVILGDSSAAGYGVRRRRETLGALLATGLSRRLHRPYGCIVSPWSARSPPGSGRRSRPPWSARRTWR